MLTVCLLYTSTSTILTILYHIYHSSTNQYQKFMNTDGRMCPLTSTEFLVCSQLAPRCLLTVRQRPRHGANMTHISLIANVSLWSAALDVFPVASRPIESVTTQTHQLLSCRTRRSCWSRPVQMLKGVAPSSTCSRSHMQSHCSVCVQTGCCWLGTEPWDSEALQIQPAVSVVQLQGRQLGLLILVLIPPLTSYQSKSGGLVTKSHHHITIEKQHWTVELNCISLFLSWRWVWKDSKWRTGDTPASLFSKSFAKL